MDKGDSKSINDALSPRLMQMKFMKRRQESDIREKLLEEQKIVDHESHWYIQYDQTQISQPVETRIESTASYAPFTKTPLLGRQSYKNFNKAIEENMKEKEKQFFSQTAEQEQTNGISEKELASRYQQFIEHQKESDFKNKHKIEKPHEISLKSDATQMGVKKPAKSKPFSLGKGLPLRSMMKK